MKCWCGGTIEWAEGRYVPGTRACRRCLAMYAVRGIGPDRRLVPQGVSEVGTIDDLELPAPVEQIYRVPADLYPSWREEDQT